MMISDIISVAPMMGYTDRHFRYLVRLISQKTRLYTEMLTINEVLQGRTDRVLAIDPIEPPITFQLGGSDPLLLAQCTKLATEAGYDEINLNVGCPSQRVQNGAIGACLMLKPQLVADCFSAMQAVSNVPVTIKCRLGVDEYESYDHLTNFVATVADAGCQKFIIHARKALLRGLSPKQNRNIPPLNYDMVYRLKHDFPSLYIVINGGIKTVDEAITHLENVEGVMMGRAIYQNPYLLAKVDTLFYQHDNQVTERSVVEKYIDYINTQLALGVSLNKMTRHLSGLFHGKRGAHSWRKGLNQCSLNKNAYINVIHEALAYVFE